MQDAVTWGIIWAVVILALMQIGFGFFMMLLAWISTFEREVWIILGGVAATFIFVAIGLSWVPVLLFALFFAYAFWVKHTRDSLIKRDQNAIFGTAKENTDDNSA